MIPRGCARSGTGSRVLVEQSVDVGPEPPEVEGWCACKDGDSSVGWNELALPERYQLADGHPVAGDDERLSAIERTHDLAALVAKLPLGDFPPHPSIVARVLRGTARIHPRRPRI